jgi:uncharacterized protein (TIGR03067 family)
MSDVKLIHSTMPVPVISKGTSMRPLITVLTLAVLAAPAFSADDAEKKELKAMEGKWTIETLEFNGENLKDKVKIKFTIKDGAMTLEGDEETVKEYPKIALKLDPAAMPKLLDLKVTGGNQNDAKMEGIYELKADELKMCINVLGAGRPAEFKSAESTALLVLKREK